MVLESNRDLYVAARTVALPRLERCPQIATFQRRNIPLLVYGILYLRLKATERARLSGRSVFGSAFGAEEQPINPANSKMVQDWCKI
jgi:hypothetical protein